MKKCRSVPPIREVALGDGGIVVDSISARLKKRIHWSSGAIELPVGLSPGGITLCAARASEWNTDVLVELDDGQPVELWRLSPQRLRVRLAEELKQAPRPTTAVEVTHQGFRYRANGQLLVDIVVTESPFGAQWTTSYISNYEYDFFISYKSNRREKAERLADALGKHGHRVWIDREQLFGNYREEIISAVRTSEVFIILWSEGSNSSRDDDWGRGPDMCQATEIHAIRRERDQRGDHCILIWHLDGAKPGKDVTDNCSQIVRAEDRGLEEYADRAHAWLLEKRRKGCS
jgi:TIR domain